MNNKKYRAYWRKQPLNAQLFNLLYLVLSWIQLYVIVPLKHKAGIKRADAHICFNDDEGED